MAPGSGLAVTTLASRCQARHLAVVGLATGGRGGSLSCAFSSSVVPCSIFAPFHGI